MLTDASGLIAQPASIEQTSTATAAVAPHPTAQERTTQGGAYVMIDLCSCPGLIDFDPKLREQFLVGTYKIVSQDVEVGGTATQPLGKSPHGYLVLKPTHFVAFYTGDNRKFGTSVADKAALLDTLIGWSGTYRVEGDKLIQASDVSWTENQNGKTSVETWQLSGSRLTTTMGPMPYPRDPSKTLIRREVWEKVE